MPRSHTAFNHPQLHRSNSYITIRRCSSVGKIDDDTEIRAFIRDQPAVLSRSKLEGQYTLMDRYFKPVEADDMED